MTKPKVVSIDCLTDYEVSEVLNAAADKRDYIREAIVLVYYKNGAAEIFPTQLSIEREALLLQVLQEHLTMRIKREMA